MKHVLGSVLLATLALTPSFALADARSYNDAGARVTHDCAKDGPEVDLNGADSTFVFTGTCTKISINGSTLKVTIEKIERLAINGSSNVVAIAAADKIAVTGSSNTVTYKAGISKALPKVSSLGTGNKVSKVK